MSEEQKKDLKIKVVVGAIVLVVAGTILALGPMLPKILASVRKNKKDPGAAAKYYYIGTIFKWTGRGDDAIKTYEEFWLNYVDDAAEEWDWEAVQEESKYEEEAFIPWKIREFEEADKTKPAPIRGMTKKEKELFGKILANMAKYYRDKRDHRCDHLYACLEKLWPSGSELQKIGADGVKWKKTRSF